MFENQSIRKLANFIESKTTKTILKNYTFNHVINVKKSGNLPPLFCMHGGGSHFFFYNALSLYVNPNRPVYAVQASEAEGHIILHDSIEHMAKEFLKEIKIAAPKGPYHIMSYCYNTAVALEIARTLKKENQSVNLIIADSMSRDQDRYAPSKANRRVKGFIIRLIKNPFNAIYLFSKSLIIERVRPFLNKTIGSKVEKDIETLRTNLANNYLKYNWIPSNVYISLLMTKTRDPTRSPEMIESWNKISKKEVKVRLIKGEHSKLFQEPTVKNTGKEIEKCMSFFESKKNTSDGNS